MNDTDKEIKVMKLEKTIVAMAVKIVDQASYIDTLQSDNLDMTAKVAKLEREIKNSIDGVTMGNKDHASV